jgi:hypothetical protein
MEVTTQCLIGHDSHGGKSVRTTYKPPGIWTTPNCSIHTFSANESKCSQICAPIAVQSNNFNTAQSYTAWIPHKFPKYQ